MERLDGAVAFVDALAEVEAALTAGARWVVLDGSGIRAGDGELLLAASRRAMAREAVLIVAGGDPALIAGLPVAHRPLWATSRGEVLGVLRMGPPSPSPVDRAKRPLWSLRAPSLE
jgi:hypothetical protein